MTVSFWNKKHIEKYRKTDWVTKPSIFAQQCIEFFSKASTLLEIGAGQGGDAGYFQSLGYNVIATDYSDEALKLAKSKVKNVQFANVDTASGLPFENQSFNIVYSHMALHYFDSETTTKVFADIHRVLKPGGLFATMTNTMNDPEKEKYNYVELEPGYYQDPKGIKKRYFSVDTIADFTKELFEPMLLDGNGERYRDLDLKLVRFIGRKQ